MNTVYDRVAYPSSLCGRTHPDRLAVLARLAGLDPVPPHQARILEVGGGNCFNLTAVAAAYPGCDAHGFDLSSAAVEMGQDLIARSGMTNITLVVENILEAHRRYPARSFDYVIVHGVYAWVPDAVRAAIMPLIGHLLSDRGVAVVSYNAKPGGHIRQILRDALLDIVDGIDDPADRIEAARNFLEEYLGYETGDDVVAAALKRQAAQMLEKSGHVLFHDELGEFFSPQRLVDVVRTAQRSGLRYLTDSGRGQHLSGFLEAGSLPEENVDELVLRAATLEDFVKVRFFRMSVFVRDECRFDRCLDGDRLLGMDVSSRARRNEDGAFCLDDDVLEISPGPFADTLDALIRAFPQRRAVAEIAPSIVRRNALTTLFSSWYVNLYVSPPPFVNRPGPRPETSPLVRGMLRGGEIRVCSLDHSLLDLHQPELSQFLLTLDGTRTIEELVRSNPGLAAEDIPELLQGAASRALLRA